MKFKSLFLLATFLFAGGLLGNWFLKNEKSYNLSVAAGPISGQAFQLAEALQEVTARHFPEIQMEIFETRGSLHGGKLLEAGEVQLALVQADQVFGDKANLVASLYSDAFQLVVRKDSGIKNVADLLGKRIALPPRKSGENKIFWFLASHYGLEKDKLKVFTGTENSTEWLFVKGEADALFRVRAPGDRSILRLIEKSNAELIPIRQASALKLKNPALERGVIPSGSYKGEPALPEIDTETVSIKRLLLASSDIPEEIIYKLTSVLFERRRELVERITLAGWIEPPDRIMGTFLPIHPGAQAFYDRNQPSFFQENAELIAVLLSILLVTSSIFIHFNSRRRKGVMDEFNQELIQLAKSSRAAADLKELDQYQADLAEYVDRIVAAVGRGKINNQDMTLFRFTFDSVEDAIRDREVQLERSNQTNQLSQIN